MNKIYYILLLICSIFFLFTDFSLFQNSIYEALDDSIKIVLDLGLLLLLWNGLFNILVESKIISKITYIFKKYFKFLYPMIDYKSEIYNYLVLNFMFNFLGMGLGGMSSSLKVIEKLNEKKCYKEMEDFVILNIGCFTFVPISLIGYLVKHNFELNINFLICSFLLTLMIHLTSILILKVVRK